MEGDIVLKQPPIFERFSLKNKVALVTGAGQGIGRAFAHALGEAGASVAVIDVVAERARHVSHELEKKKNASLDIVADVSKKSDVDLMIQKIIQWKGTLDIAVNNAGICINKPAEEMSVEEWDSVMNINLKGVFLCAQAEAKVMIPKRYGKIINTASMSASIVNYPQPQCAYNASKAGVVHLTKSLASEWASKGIRVNSISPGYMNTALIQQNPKLTPLISTWVQHTPLGTLGEVTDLQGAIVYLASPASDFMTGHDLVIDGGFTIW